MKTLTHLILALLAFACIALPACHYDDGPLVSLRSKGRRMIFTRPLTRYVSSGIDSTAEINQIFLDSLLGFTGDFTFYYDPTADYNLIMWDEFQPDPERGIWYAVNNELDAIMTVIPNQTWGNRWQWRITRLSNKQLWLERDGGYELRFEE